MTHQNDTRPQAVQELTRRPIASRRLAIMQSAARQLARLGVTPNAISLSSVVFAGLGAAAMAATSWIPKAAPWLWLLAAVCIQLRLLANLFDGMVAVEHGKATPGGVLYNEVPDRVSDAALFIALGFAPGGSVHLGYLVAILAVFVAYVRAMGGSAGVGQVFRGWMGKSQRMFVATLLCLAMAAMPNAWTVEVLATGWGLPAWTLAFIAGLCLVTVTQRLRIIARRLQEAKS